MPRSAVAPLDLNSVGLMRLGAALCLSALDLVTEGDAKCRESCKIYGIFGGETDKF